VKKLLLVIAATASLLAGGVAALPAQAAPAPTPDQSERGFIEQQPLPAGFGNPSAAAIAQGIDGDVWFDEGDRAVRLDAQGVVHGSPLTLPSSSSVASTVSDDGTLWLGSVKQVAVVHRDGTTSTFGSPNLYPTSLFHLSDDSVWSIGGNQLDRLDPSGSAIAQAFTIPRLTPTTGWSGVKAADEIDDRFWFTGTQSTSPTSAVVGTIATDGTVQEWSVPGLSTVFGIDALSNGSAIVRGYSAASSTEMIVAVSDSGVASSITTGSEPTWDLGDGAGGAWVVGYDQAAAVGSQTRLTHVTADGGVVPVALPAGVDGGLQFAPAVVDGRLWFEPSGWYDGSRVHQRELLAVTTDGDVETYGSSAVRAVFDRGGSTVMLLPGGFGTPYDVSTDRVSGTDRFDTGVALAAQAYPTTAPVVVVATGTDYPDALAAGPVASHLGGPLLLTRPDTLPADVAAEVRSLAPATIVIAGGTKAVSPTVEQQLGAIASDLHATVTRVSGADRFATALALDRYAFHTVSGAWVATGTNFPDALAAASAAGSEDEPIVLVNGLGSTADATASVAAVGATSVRIAGGEAAVSPGIESALTTKLGAVHVTRSSGVDRFATATAIAGSAFPTGATTAFIATGTAFPDALSGSAIAAAKHAPMLTVRPECVPGDTLATIAALGVSRLEFIGGTSALTPDVAALTSCS
jgi:putative cell wall-binding protein